MDALERVLRDLQTLFEELSLEWYLFGAQASNLYGVPRTTADVDVTIAPPHDVPTFIDALTRYGFEVRVEDPVAFAETASVLPAVHRPTAFPVDIVIGRSGLEAEFFDRVRSTEIDDGLRVPVISAEDLIISKVLAGRPKDLTDAEGVFVANAGLDVGRIRTILGLLETALGQSDLVRIVDGWASPNDDAT